ncbi:hypothetical protein ACJJTC_004362 [Scirpophaga incertulas]
MEDELSSTRDLFHSLLHWFQTPEPSMQKEAMCLLLTLIKTQSGTYIAKQEGINNFLDRLSNVRRHVSDPVALEIYNDIVSTLKFLHTVESNDNIVIPALDTSSPIREDGDSSENCNPEAEELSKESFLTNMHHISKNANDNNSDGIKIFLFPWVEMSSSDLKTILLIEDALKLLKSVRRCCRFIRDVFLRDFPAEIFLNRPSIVQNLQCICEKTPGIQSEETLIVLLCITEALMKRLEELCSIDLIHNSSKFSDDCKTSYNDYTNLELEKIVCNGEMKPPGKDSSLVALRQLPAPFFALDIMNNVLSNIIKNVELSDLKNESEFSKETNVRVHLVESLIQLLLTCVSKKFWAGDHFSKTQRDIAHKCCMVMRLLADLLVKYRKKFTMSGNAYIRAIWLRLLLCSEQMLDWASDSALPPSSLLSALHVAQLDPAIHLIYPQISDRITLVLQRAKTSVDHEYKTKYRELMKLTACMDDAVRFIKNKNNCRSSKSVLSCIKSSLPVLELHMSEFYLDEVADILLYKSKDLNFDDNDWSVARGIAMQLMAHNVEWVRAKFYTKMEDLVKLVLVGDEDNEGENERCLTLLFDVGILTEICCHGLSAKLKQVEVSANEIILYLLRGRLILSEPCWWRLLASLLPVLPLLHVYAAHDTQLGKAICKSLELDIAACMGVSLAEVTAGLARLLFVRCVAVQLDAAHSLCRLLVILVFPANESAVTMCTQLLCLITWSGFVLQELNTRKRVPALPACVTARTVLPFEANSYWNTSTNAEHSAIEWLSNDEEYRSSLRVRWWCAFEGVARVCRGAPPPPAPLSFQPTDRDRALLKATCPLHSTSAALLGLENATSHTQVTDALSSLECYLHLVPWSTVSVEEFTSLPWHHMRRFLRAPPASMRDTALLIAIMHFIFEYLEHVASEGSDCWVKALFVDNDTAVLSLLSREQLLPQQTAQESIEVAHLHTHIVKNLRLCVQRLEYQDYDSNKLESLLKILLSCLDRIELKNFHALGKF